MIKNLIPVLCICFGIVQAVQAKMPTQTSGVSQNSPEAKSDYLDLSWRDIETLTQQLSEPLKGKQWTGILAITRGGMFPAGLLAQSLNIRRIETISVKSYDHQKSRGEIVFLNVPNIKDAGEMWLIVDDLVDSGKTVEAVRKLFPKGVYVALLAKPQGLPMVDHHVRKVDQKTWVIFPWEKGAAETD